MTAQLKEREILLDKKTAAEECYTVCFVCTGNTCRSPMAEAVANALAKTHGKKLRAVSAGLYAAEGDPIAQNAVLALENAGVEPLTNRDYHTHTAHTLCAEEAERYDLLVGLTDRHAMELILRFPNLTERVTCLTPSIPDPFGGDLACYETCLAQITDAVLRLLFSDCL